MTFEEMLEQLEDDDKEDANRLKEEGMSVEDMLKELGYEELVDDEEGGEGGSDVDIDGDGDADAGVVDASDGIESGEEEKLFAAIMKMEDGQRAAFIGRLNAESPAGGVAEEVEPEVEAPAQSAPSGGGNGNALAKLMASLRV